MTTPDDGPTFEQWYAGYPRKENPRDARKAWGQALKRGFTPKMIETCTAIAMATTWKGRLRGFLPYPASFLRAQEPIEERVEALADEVEEGTHLCDLCKPQHHWQGEPWDGLPRLYPCLMQRDKMRELLASKGEKVKMVAKNKLCEKCGYELSWRNCYNCEDGFSYHDCGEDSCCCLNPEDNVTCDICFGRGGWLSCSLCVPERLT